MAGAVREDLPWWSWAAPLVGLVLVGLGLSGLSWAGIGMVVALFGSVFASVLHAEVVAARVGEPYGTLVLAIAVTVIETGLILALMAGGDQPTLLRDSVFASVITCLNGLMGIALMLGGARHFEQGFAARGASAFLSVVIAIATMTLVLPNYTRSAEGAAFSQGQLLVVAFLAVALYAVFLFVMTVRHRNDFLHGHGIDPSGEPPSLKRTGIAFGLMCVSLLTVVLLAKKLAPALETGVEAIGAPQTVVGVVVALLALMPEGVSAIRAAARNQLQMSLNLVLGSALACIGLTIPAVALVALWQGEQLVLGLEPSGTVILALTCVVSILTLAHGRTTLLQGAVHLVILAGFLMLSFMP